MRILHTETSLHWGGQEMRIVEQSRWLNSRGHETWIAARPGAQILEHAKALSLPSVEIAFRGNLNPFAIGGLHRFIGKHKIDIVDCHSSRDASHCAVLRLLGRRVVRSLHLEAIHTGKLHGLAWRFGSDRVIVVSNILRQRLIAKGLPSQSIDVIREGIDLQDFNANRSTCNVREELGIAGSCRLIANIGMIRPDKGQRYFVESAEAIAAAIPDVRFLIVGSPTRPEFEAELRASVEASSQRDKFILTGYRQDVANLIQASDCVVISSLQEAHSRVALEAFALKRPVVATNAGGLPEVVKDGVTGTLVPKADAAAIASGVIATLESDRSAQVDNAYAMVQARSSFDEMMKRTMASYEAALCH